MTGRAFLPALLGTFARIAVEAAFGADLSDITGAGWTWTDVTADAQHNPGIPVTIGRTDNVSQAGASPFTVTLDNGAGRYTYGGPADIGVRQNTPVRERMTLDGTTWTTRFQGYLDTANPVTDQSATVKKAQVRAYGMLQRLGGRKKPLRSALYRQFTTNPGVVADWPLEDGQSATSGASAIIGQPALALDASAGTVKFAADAPPGSEPLPDFSGGGQMSATFSGATAGSFAVSFAIRMLDVTAYSTVPIVFFTSAGRWEMEYDNLFGGFTFVANYLGATTHGVGITSALTDGKWHLITFSATQSGADISFSCTTDGATISGTILAETVGTIQKVQVAPHVGTTQTSNTVTKWPFEVGHIQIVSPTLAVIPPTAAADFSAFNGWAGETADARLTRLCTEQGVALALTGTSTTTMGAQTVDTIVNLLRECEAADHGILFDGLGPGISYVTRSARYNAATALTLDMGAPRHVDTLAPVFDKQAIKNLYTVTRKGGGNATYEKVTGPTGTALLGIEDAAVTINLATDDPLLDHAAWLVGLGTQLGFRYPNAGVNLLNAPGRAAAVLALTPGERVTIVNPASKATDLPPGQIDLMVEGWTETTTADTWSITLNTSPYAPNDIFVLDSDVLDGPALLAL